MNKIRIAIITGAGSGIGRNVAIALHKDNWTVVLAGRRKNLLEETASLCGNKNTLTIATDITVKNSVEHLFQKTKEEFGQLDLLFNNAGISAPAKPFEDLTLLEWQNVINTNVTGAFLCTQEAFKLMKNQNIQGGRIINNGSISAHVPRPQSAPYTASKHAITGLTKSTSLDGRKYNIACGQIDIGNAASAMTQTIEKGIVQADGSLKAEATIDISEVGRTVVYIANLPLNTNVPFVTIMANQMPYMGRG
ncbi:SDR family NAD(P)-dependent oxidoreductase [Kriegella sp. EG-1]|nr:SDR family NAD(P)-dependent oxidoreductase [Flavobacteriaceae bacterium EG-1]